MQNSTQIIQAIKEEEKALQNGTLESISPNGLELLDIIVEQMPPVDFKAKVYPIIPKLLEQLRRLESEQKSEEIDKEILKVKKQISGLKVNRDHYKIIVIQEVLDYVKKHNWGLCKRHSFIYLYNGKYWDLLDQPDLQKFLSRVAKKMGVSKWIADNEDFNTKLYKQFIFMAHLPEPKIDTSKTLVNLRNGTFRVTQKGGTLEDFRAEDFLTYQLPFDYNTNAKAPLFHKYLHAVLPDKERQNVIAEYLAYVFTRHLKLEKTLLLYGTGANGKSVFFEIVNAMLGEENVTCYSLESLTDKSGYYRAKIANSLVNYASEINGKLQTDHFKQLVSGEPIEARLPHKEPLNIRNYARLIFNCNELPRTVEHTKAYFRRFLIIYFEVTIPEHEQDKELASKIIKNELSGVFNWVLEGLQRLINQKKFSRCQSAETQLNQYRKESDSVQMFLEEKGYIPSVDKHESVSGIHREYTLFCSEYGFNRVALKKFKHRLVNAGFIVERKNYGNAVFIEQKTF